MDDWLERVAYSISMALGNDVVVGVSGDGTHLRAHFLREVSATNLVWAEGLLVRSGLVPRHLLVVVTASAVVAHAPDVVLGEIGEFEVNARIS